MVKCLECEKSAGSVAHGRKSGPVTVTPDDLKKTRKSLLVTREMESGVSPSAQTRRERGGCAGGAYVTFWNIRVGSTSFFCRRCRASEPIWPMYSVQFPALQTPGGRIRTLRS